MTAHPTAPHPIFGRLTWDSVPMAHEPILLWTFIAVVLGGIAVLALLTKFRLWGPLWRDWFCSIDHKRIGIMYMVLGIVMLLRGFSDAIMIEGADANASADHAERSKASADVLSSFRVHSFSVPFES